MTPFTSFVVVEETAVTPGGRPTRVALPVNMPEGVSYEGVFGRSGARYSEPQFPFLEISLDGSESGHSF